jgi:hypothetical protein
VISGERATGGWRQLHDKALRKLYYTPDNIVTCMIVDRLWFGNWIY